CSITTSARGCRGAAVRCSSTARDRASHRLPDVSRSGERTCYAFSRGWRRARLSASHLGCAPPDGLRDHFCLAKRDARFAETNRASWSREGMKRPLHGDRAGSVPEAGAHRERLMDDLAVQVDVEAFDLGGLVDPETHEDIHDREDHEG